jgi:hypothetical protein
VYSPQAGQVDEPGHGHWLGRGKKEECGLIITFFFIINNNISLPTYELKNLPTYRPIISQSNQPNS